MWKLWQFIHSRPNWNDGRGIDPGSLLLRPESWHNWDILIWSDTIRVLQEKGGEERLTIMVKT